jgi:hypothetical protein
MMPSLYLGLAERELDTVHLTDAIVWNSLSDLHGLAALKTIPFTDYHGCGLPLLSPSKQMPEYYLKLGHDHFLSLFYPFVIH